ncbi:hypothetical protein CHUAL_004358 [Chamberlinius hualienensis]
MLQSYVKVSKEVKQLLLLSNELHQVSSIHDDVVGELVSFLKPFLKCTEISSDKSPTIQLVAKWLNKLHDHLQPKELNSAELLILKTQARSYEEYCKLSSLHYITSILDPKFRKLKFVEENIRQNTYESLLKLIVGEYQKYPGINSLNKKNCNSPKPKKSKFSDFEDSSDDESSDVQSLAKTEFESYMRHKLINEVRMKLQFIPALVVDLVEHIGLVLFIYPKGTSVNSVDLLDDIFIKPGFNIITLEFSR